jgi:adenylate cyclase
MPIIRDPASRHAVRKAFVWFVAVPLLANFFGVMLLLQLNPIIFSSADLAVMDRFWSSLSTIPLILAVIGQGILPFAVAVGIIQIYMRPVTAFAFGRLERIEPSRLINAPFMISLLGVSGWLISIASDLLMSRFVKGFASHVAVFDTVNLLVGLFVFVFSYYCLEWYSRRRLFPVLFPGNHLSGFPGAIHLPVRARFFIFLFAVSIFPVGMLALAFFSIASRTRSFGFNVQTGPFIMLVSVVMLLAILVTLLLSAAFQEPLVEMSAAASKIEKNDFNVTVRVGSTDELGKLGESMNTMSKGLGERERIRDAFGRVVDPAVRDYLLSGNLRLGGEYRLATVLFSDIRGFTSLSEDMPPDRVVELLNRYFDAMHTAISAHHGLVSKYIGDAVMALFGVPADDPFHADNAVNAALAMREARAGLNRDLLRDGFPELRAGIGIHTGSLLAGNIGSSARMEYTVIGDTVNVASRLESLCKETGRDIHVSESTKLLLRQPREFDALESFNVKGRKEAVKVFAL